MSGWPSDPWAEKRAAIEQEIKERIALIDAAYKPRIERAASRQWGGELKRLLSQRGRDVDHATRDLVKIYAALPIPPIVIPRHG